MKYFIIFITIIFVSCNPKPKSPENKSWKLKKLNTSIKLPNEFKPITINEYIEKLKKIPNSSGNGSILQLEQVRNTTTKYQLFYDTTSFVNNILFLELDEHIMIDKGAATAYVSLLEEDLYQSYLRQGTEYYRLELKYYGKIDIQMITIRYKITKDEMSKYISQYVVSTKNKTISVTTQNISNIDFGETVNTMRIN